jgi:enamine deaminase RidA (YjgF/YER057c/UK114 family)
MKEIKKISVPGAAPPAGHYTPATLYNSMLFISGQLPVKTDGSHTFNEPFEV